MGADRIFHRMKKIEKFNELKSYCFITALISYVILLSSSVELYIEFGKTYINNLAITITLFGIIIPMIWLLFDKRKYGVLFH